MHAFLKFLGEHRNGVTLDLLGEGLQQLVAAVSDEQKAGSLVLTISVKPLGKGDGLEVAAKVDVKAPKTAPGVSIFFATPNNDLTRSDPRQIAMELREVAPSSPARSLA